MTRYASKEAYENNLEYIKKFNKESYRQFAFKLNKIHDPEMIEWLEQQDNIQGYLNELISKDMNDKLNDIEAKEFMRVKELVKQHNAIISDCLNMLKD